MAKLPVTVTAVTPKAGGLYNVTVVYYDGTVGQFLIPPTLATAEAVYMSALVMATLSDMVTPSPNARVPHHRRYLPR